MTDVAMPLSFDGLPMELIDFIMPNPSALADQGAGKNKPAASWMPITTMHGYWSREVREAMHTLRALSRTSRRLRAAAMPRLWATIRVTTVEELGLLRDTLRTSKHLAPLIRQFSFAWTMNEDSRKCEQYSAEHGSWLDMAFIDRGAVWRRMHEELGCEVEFQDAPGGGDPGDAFFTLEGTIYIEPGKQYQWQSGLELPSELGLGKRSSGPDGTGPDARIKNPEELLESLAEVVGRLKLLRSFAWHTIMPMPDGVFQALLKADQLTALHTSLFITRKEHTKVPLWELAARLENLSILRGSHTGVVVDPMSLGLASEEELLSFEIPLETSTEQDNEEFMHVTLDSVAHRAIVAAAKGGHLRRLMINRGDEAYGLWKPFAVPSLLPHWVRIEGWGDSRLVPSSGWLGAAAMLRPALFHTSLRGAQLGTTVLGASRTLIPAEVQGMYANFKRFKLPVVHFNNPRARRALRVGTWLQGDEMAQGTAVERYMLWLRDDLALAEQVADAWNDIVGQGSADLVKCYCRKCLKLPQPKGFMMS